MAAARAQTVQGVIEGVVSGPVSKPIPGAAVTLTSDQTGSTRSVTTNQRGEFTIPLVPPGTYVIQAASEGFRNFPQKLTLEVNQEIHVDIPMLIGSPDTVEIPAIQPLLRTETSAMGGVIDNQMVTGLPLDGRNFYQLSLLLPGVLPSAEGSAGSVRGAFTINVNGAREDSNNFLLDGAYNADPKLNGVSVTPPVDAIREFEVATSTYDPTFRTQRGRPGQRGSAQRQRRSRFHGTAYEFFSNAALDGTNFFAPAGEPVRYQRNQFGGSLGGPLVKNRTFFFLDYQGTRTNAGQPLVTNVPTAAERVGDFSHSALVPIDPTTGMPFPTLKIPSYYMSPIGLAIAALYPLPNRNVPGANYVSAPIATDNQNQFDLRLDHKLTRSDDLFARYSFINDGVLCSRLAALAFSRCSGIWIKYSKPGAKCRSRRDAHLYTGLAQ